MTQADRLVRLAEAAVAERGLPMRYDGAAAMVAIGDDALRWATAHSPGS